MAWSKSATRETRYIASLHAFAIYDRYPVNKGHVLIIPRRHCADYFDLTASEQAACWELVVTVREILQNTLAPDGFNIGINIGQAADQTIFKVHIHLIPRFLGDMQDPEGGVRGGDSGEEEVSGTLKTSVSNFFSWDGVAIIICGSYKNKTIHLAFLK